ncbi:right-handed parallel beta-helix repeat-containing protein [Haladaptatus salinisoli]|uniref:right-handed parallel beta-helix repeat-containing protein n=1 Tax=Haladaptatus salinisoli TaxID=2884876 RepID=UPI001D0BDFF5|nr:right-handed parallel beta-helix repeat-containing protein [Haladaptatus salinisoli]
MSGPPERAADTSATNRRSYLKLAAGALTTGVALGGASAATGGSTNGGTVDAAVTTDDFQFDRTYDVVDDLGMDPTGQEPIDDALQNNVRSNTKLEFPQGEYRVTDLTFDFGNGLHDFGMVGVEPGATIVLDTTNDVTGNSGAYWLSLGGAGSSNILYEGLRHDAGGAPEAPRMQLIVDDGLLVRDVLHRGRHGGSKGPFLFGVRTSSGTGLVENLRAPDGAPDGSGAVGVFVEMNTTGELEFRNCHLAGFPNNGLYQSGKSTGTVRVVGGLYRNNNIANVRLAGTGGEVRDCCVVVDAPHSDPEFPTNMRGVWLRGRDATVENCDVTLAADTVSDGGVLVGGSGTHEIRSTRIRVDTDETAAMYAAPPETTPAPVRCTNVQVTGDASHTTGGYPGSAAVRAYGRPGSVFESCCVEQTGADRDGILLQYCDASRISGSSFDVTGEPIVLDNSSSVARRNNDAGSASCASPSCSYSPTTTVDGFEDGTLAEYEFDRGESGARVVSTPTERGGNALEIGGTNTEMISTSGLPTYPRAGDTFGYWLRGDGGAADSNLSYGVQGHDDRYFVRVDIANDDLVLFRYENGTAHRLDSDSTGYSLSQGSWYELVVDWAPNGGHMVTLRGADGNRIARVSASDSAWSDGGVGYDAYLGCGERLLVDAVGIK